MISFEEFKKIELRIAEVSTAERIENSDKLLRLEVSLGEEQRQIIAGIGQSYRPEDLVHKKIIIVANLEPRTLMSLESQGMILAARDQEGAPVILELENNKVASGTLIT